MNPHIHKEYIELIRDMKAFPPGSFMHKKYRQKFRDFLKSVVERFGQEECDKLCKNK